MAKLYQIVIILEPIIIKLQISVANKKAFQALSEKLGGKPG